MCLFGLGLFPSNPPEPHLPDGLAEGTCGHHLADPLDISLLSGLPSHIPMARSFPIPLPDLPSCSSDVCSLLTALTPSVFPGLGPSLLLALGHHFLWPFLFSQRPSLEHRPGLVGVKSRAASRLPSAAILSKAIFRSF